MGRGAAGTAFPHTAIAAEAAQRRKLYQSRARLPRLLARRISGARIAGVGSALRRRLVLARIVRRGAVAAGCLLAARVGLLARIAGAVLLLVAALRIRRRRRAGGVLAVVGALAARGRVMAHERLADERLLGLGELAAELADRLLHVGAPDQRRERAAVDGAAEELRV